MIGRLHHLIIDCPDPEALAAFYSELIGQPITYRSDDFVVVAEDGTTSGLAFQRAVDHQPPLWPDPSHPQQMHLDVMVDDVEEAEPRVLALGATRLAAGERGYHVYADPAGHPFCLIPRPSWAPPVNVPVVEPVVDPVETVETPGVTTEQRKDRRSSLSRPRASPPINSAPGR